MAKVMRELGASSATRAGDQARAEASLLGDLQHSVEPCRNSKYTS